MSSNEDDASLEVQNESLYIPNKDDNVETYERVIYVIKKILSKTG